MAGQKFPQCLNGYLFRIFRSIAKCLYSYYTISLETSDDVFETLWFWGIPVGKHCTSPFRVSCITIHLIVTSHPLFGFSRGLLASASAFLTKDFVVPVFFIRVSPIPGSVMWSTLQFVQKKNRSDLYSIQFFLSVPGIRISSPLGKNNYVQLFVGNLLGSILNLYRKKG